VLRELAFNGRDMLALRTDAMLHALDRASAAVAEVQGLDTQLGQRLSGRFDGLAGPVRDHLADAQRDRTEDDRFMKDGETVLAETLAFLGGASARKLGLDDGLAALAQSWLDRLSSDAGLNPVAVVVPALAETAHMEAQIIRLRLPVHGIWGLPVAVHEYGHFVASELKRRDDHGGVPHQVSPVERALYAAGAGDQHADGRPALYFRGHELFADAVAALVAGPAYLRYCLRYRFDPADANTPEPRHPSSASRVQMQLDVLDLLVGKDGGDYLGPDTKALASTWQASVESAAGEPPDQDRSLDELAAKLLEALEDSPELQQIRYSDHDIAHLLANKTNFNAAGPAHSVAHVLNAAWIRRDRMEAEGTPPGEWLDEVSSRTGELVAKVAAHG
jgi:hypothetical protein